MTPVRMGDSAVRHASQSRGDLRHVDAAIETRRDVARVDRAIARGDRARPRVGDSDAHTDHATRRGTPLESRLVDGRVDVRILAHVNGPFMNPFSATAPTIRARVRSRRRRRD